MSVVNIKVVLLGLMGLLMHWFDDLAVPTMPELPYWAGAVIFIVSVIKAVYDIRIKACTLKSKQIENEIKTEELNDIKNSEEQN